MVNNNDNTNFPTKQVPKKDILPIGSLTAHGPSASLKLVLLIVAAASMTMQAALFFASDLIVTPDSAGYISLAHGLVENVDFRQDYFQFRTPAYPMFLAVIFKIFGKTSVIVLPLLQHVMVVSSVLLTCLTAYELKPSRSFALIAGLISAGGFHGGAYANAVLTETPYALTVIICVYYNVRYLGRGERKSIIIASCAAGIATMIRPVGQGMIVVCIVVVFLRYLFGATSSHSKCISPPKNAVPSRSLLQRPAFEMAMALLPALLIVGPWLGYKASLYGRFDLSYAGNMAFYQRAVVHEGVDPSGFPAFAPIGRAIQQAQDSGYIDKNLPHQDFYTAVSAYQYAYKTPLSDAAYAVGEVGQQMMLASQVKAISRTPKHAYRTFFMPDKLYRFLPDGTPGENGKLAKNTVLFSSDSYAGLVTQNVGYDTMQTYLPLQQSANVLTRPWASFCQWYRARIELGKPILGLLDTPYEEWMALTLIGCVVALIHRDRKLYLALGFIIAYHTVITSFYGGALPRYIVPITAVLSIFSALPLSLVYDFCTIRMRNQSYTTSRKISAIPA